MSYQEFMHQKNEEVRISISLSNLERKAVEELMSFTGSGSYYDNPEYYKEVENRFKKEIILKNVSFHEAQTFAEPIRIANPDQCVSIYAGDNSFIGNTSWNDQLKMFFEYPTFTEIGKSIMEARQAEANAQGIQASWE